MASTALTKVDPAAFQITPISEEVAQVIHEELDGLGPIPFDTVKVPSGGGIAFEVPSDDPESPDSEKSLVGVIVYHLPPRVKIVPLAAPAPAAEPEPETLPTKAAEDPTPPALPTEKHLTPASAPRGKGLPPKKTLYHFTCKDCGGTFTVFGQYRDGDTVKCSSCGSTNEFKDSFASFDAYCDKCGGHVYGRTNSEDTEMVWTCRCRNDLILTWNKKLRKYTNGGK